MCSGVWPLWPVNVLVTDLSRHIAWLFLLNEQFCVGHAQPASVRGSLVVAGATQQCWSVHQLKDAEIQEIILSGYCSVMTWICLDFLPCSCLLIAVSEWFLPPINFLGFSGFLPIFFPFSSIFLDALLFILFHSYIGSKQTLAQELP